ncbi:hypothetical protein [Demequina globuliformis]|uniref:hypothetical protein n=1 Tax=Demequina globuliformis TaxID=676202 RepID=UPI000785E6BC|nr:hypothetical protein [Demequina globuliformis]
MTTQTVLEIIGWTGSLLIVASLMQARVLKFRWMNFAGALIATIYNGIIEVWPFAFMNLAITIIDIYWLRRLYRERNDATVYRALPVSADDSYLQHVLAFHAEDIARHRADFRALPLDGERRTVFLLVNGDEAIGVVSLTDAGDGTGRIDLDWVKQRFRDFSPGEFVYKESSVLADAGFSRVEMPHSESLDSTYLTKVGFVREGDRWVRTVSA